jgi:hypothetical protein
MLLFKLSYYSLSVCSRPKASIAYLRGQVKRVEHVHHRLFALARERLLPLAELQAALGLERRVVVLIRVGAGGRAGGRVRMRME